MQAGPSLRSALTDAEDKIISGGGAGLRPAPPPRQKRPSPDCEADRGRAFLFAARHQAFLSMILSTAPTAAMAVSRIYVAVGVMPLTRVGTKDAASRVRLSTGKFMEKCFLP